MYVLNYVLSYNKLKCIKLSLKTPSIKYINESNMQRTSKLKYLNRRGKINIQKINIDISKKH